jgi:predicted metal-dependent peptidase
MARQCHNLNMKIIICDAKIHEVYDIRNGNIKDIMAIKIKGGGGTSHMPVYEYMEKYHGQAKLLINFTDGFTQYPDHDPLPNMETVWVLTQNSINPERIPFGHVIRLDGEV